MIPYEYRPTPEKRKEKLLTALLFSVAILFFAGSYLPGIPVPWAFQSVAVGALGGCIYLVSRYLSRSFSYRVEDSSYGDFTDLIIVEKIGKKTRTVCRIAVSDVQNVERLTRENRKPLLEKTKKSRVYQYHAQMEPTDHYLLTFLENEESSYLLISADQALIDRISPL